MDDERMPGRPADPAAEPPVEPPPSAPAPPTGSPPAAWSPPVAWEEPRAADRAGTFDVGSAFSRTLDTFVAEWPTFVALSIPTAVVGLLVQLVALDVRTLASAGLSVLLSLLSIPVNMFVLLALIVAADDVRAGRPVSAGSAASRALGRTAAGIGSVVAMAVIAVAIGAFPLLFLFATRGNPVFAVATVIAVLFLIYAVIRWSLAYPAIALDGAGPIEALRRSWSAMGGNMWRLGVLVVGLYLIAIPLATGAGLLLFSENRLVGPAVTAVVTLVVGPIVPIALAVAWGDLTDRPRADQPRPPDRRARYAFVGIVLIAGVVLLVPGVATLVDELPQLGLAGVPAEDRGRIVAGTGRNPLDPCRPTNVKPTFGTGEAIYLGGYFNRTILPGQAASVDVYLDGTLAATSEIRATTQAIACYYELAPLTGMPAADYVIVVRDAAGTLAEGAFRVE